MNPPHIWRGTDELETDLALARPFMQEASLVYARLLELIEADLPRWHDLLERTWQGRTFTARYERPGLLLASLRFRALVSGSTHPLWAALAATDPDPDALDMARLREATAHDDELSSCLAQRFVQTNETSRGVVWLWPAACMPASSRLELFDMGASAGLNLFVDQLPMPWTDADGRPLLSRPAAGVVARQAFDARPLDASKEDDAMWLRACVWPDQRERLQRLEAALAAARAAPPKLQQLDATEMPGYLRSQHTDTRLIAYQSLMRDYLAGDSRARFVDGMRDWLDRHASGRALWMELEMQQGRGEPPERSGVVTAHAVDVRGQLRDLELARCHPHPRRLHVNADALRALTEILQG